MKCKLCGSQGTNSATCPLNMNARRVLIKKHPLSRQAPVLVRKPISPVQQPAILVQPTQQPVLRQPTQQPVPRQPTQQPVPQAPSRKQVPLPPAQTKTQASHQLDRHIFSPIEQPSVPPQEGSISVRQSGPEMDPLWNGEKILTPDDFFMEFYENYHDSAVYNDEQTVTNYDLLKSRYIVEMTDLQAKIMAMTHITPQDKATFLGKRLQQPLDKQRVKQAFDIEFPKIYKFHKEMNKTRAATEHWENLATGYRFAGSVHDMVQSRMY